MNITDYNLKCQSCYMLGVLADKDMSNPISILNDNGPVISNIKAISVEPETIVDDINPVLKYRYYAALDNEPKNKIQLPLDYDVMPQHEKVQFWYEILRNKIICFRPCLKWDTIDKDKIIKNMIIEFVEDYDYIIPDVEFVPIPIINLGNREFENNLKQGIKMDLKVYNHCMYQPEYIICGDYIYFNFQGWEKDVRNSSVWACSKAADKIERLKIDINDIEPIIGLENNLIFIRRDILIDMEDNGESDKIANNIFDVRKPSLPKEKTSKMEVNFLEDLKKETLKNGLSYTKDDLVNLHTCIKTNPLTILAGMSGTGKSKLAYIYAKMLNCNEDETLLFLPINPSYTEPGDLLGYLNNTTGIYMPSDTRLVDFLNHANENKNKMHVVIFDEMNLSQVEYWFAPFISLLERDSGERNLYLYNPKTKCINDQQYPSSIPIADNVRFIGTVNVDETTKDFSDRLLDRANIIILQKQPFKELKEELIEFKYEKNINYEYGYYKGYSEWIKDNNWLSAYSDKEIEFFDELHEIINKYDTQKGVSFRIVKKIGEYLNNIPKDGDELMLERSLAFDLQVKQRIITKIKGTEKQFGKLVGTMNSYEENKPSNSELFNFFSNEEWKDISDFELTKKEITKKARKLGVYGYAN